jgi:glutamate synthase (NADPH/NADH) small chain
VNVGKDIDSQKLLDDNDAVLIAAGATRPRDLPIEGRDLDGIQFAMDYLDANTKVRLQPFSKTHRGLKRLAPSLNCS